MEAINLQRFYNNFEGLHKTVVWPKLIPELVRHLHLMIGLYLFDYIDHYLVEISLVAAR